MDDEELREKGDVLKNAVLDDYGKVAHAENKEGLNGMVNRSEEDRFEVIESIKDMEMEDLGVRLESVSEKQPQQDFVKHQNCKMLQSECNVNERVDKQIFEASGSTLVEMGTILEVLVAGILDSPVYSFQILKRGNKAIQAKFSSDVGLLSIEKSSINSFQPLSDD